jgi:hypothetical protein
MVKDGDDKFRDVVGLRQNNVRHKSKATDCCERRYPITDYVDAFQFALRILMEGSLRHSIGFRWAQSACERHRCCDAHQSPS